MMREYFESSRHPTGYLEIGLVAEWSPRAAMANWRRRSSASFARRRSSLVRPWDNIPRHCGVKNAGLGYKRGNVFKTFFSNRRPASAKLSISIQFLFSHPSPLSLR